MIVHSKYSPKTRHRPFGSAWWTKQRNEKLLYIMRTYNDVEKAARVLGCPPHNVIKQISFLAHIMKSVPTEGTNDNEIRSAE